MWGDPRSSNRVDPFRRSQDERFASGWNRDLLAHADGLALERNAGGFQTGRDPYRPTEFSGMLGPSGRQFASRDVAPISFTNRGLPIDFRAGDRMAQELQIRDLQARELASLDFRVRDAMTSEFRSREMHSIDYRIREELMMEYRERDRAALDFRNRVLPPLEFKDRGVPHLDYRERELLSDFRSREAPHDFRGRDVLDMDFRNKEQSHTELRDANVSDIDFRNRNQLLSDYRDKAGPHSEFLGNSSSPLDFRGKEGSQLDFRARDLPHSDFNTPGSSDLDMRGRDTALFNFQGIERPGTDQDFRERNVAETPVDIPDRVRLTPNQPIVDYIQSQPTVQTPEQEIHEDRINKTGDLALGSSLYSEEQPTDNQAQDDQSCGLPSESKNSDGQDNIKRAEDESSESTRQPLPSGEQHRTPSGRGVKRGVDLDFLGRQDTDYRNMDYRDVDLRFDYGHGKTRVQERPAKEPHQELQMGKSGRSAAKSSKIGESSDSNASSSKEEQEAKASAENFDEFVQRVSTAVNSALDPKKTEVTDVDQDYRHASTGEECASRFIQILGLPADTDKKEVIEAIRSSDGKPIEDLQLSDYNPGGVISVRSPPKEVWICGHSLVQCVKERARRLPHGIQLGISCHKAKITWMGEAGMKWDQLIPTMRELVGKSPTPDLIVVHLGENDLMQMIGVDLIIRIKRDLRYLMTLFPRAHIMWSSLLPRRVWLGAKKPAAIDRTRKEINREVKLFCRQVGMLQLQHDSIRFESPHQFSSDGEQLSEIGLEVFTVDLQASIQGWLNVR